MRSIFLFCFACAVLSGCSDTLRAPELNLEEAEISENENVYNVRSIDVTAGVVSKANQSPFLRYVTIDGAGSSPVRKVLESSAFQGRKPPANAKLPIRLVPGDVINVRQIELSTLEDGSRSQSVLTNDYTLNASGSINLSTGGSVNLSGATLEEAQARISRAISGTGQLQSSRFQEVKFPISQTGTYTIGAGDVIAVSRLVVEVNENESSQSVSTSQSVVSPNGVVSILGVGDIEVIGLSLREARSLIEQQALQSSISTDLTLDIVEFGSRSVLVTGELVTQVVPLSDQLSSIDRLLASLDLVFTNGQDYSVVLERQGRRYAMRASSLLTQYPRDTFVMLDGDRYEINRLAEQVSAQVTLQTADSRSVTYLRVAGGSDSASGVSEEVQFDLTGLDLRQLLVRQRVDVNHNLDRLVKIYRGDKEYKISAQDVLLHNTRKRFWLEPGDHIVVEDLAYVGDSVFLVGELRRPQILSIDQNARTTLAEALFSAEIFSTSDADFRHVYVLRGEGSSYDAFHFEISNVLNLSLAEDFELRPSDMVFVRTRPFSRYNRALSLVLTFVGSIDALRKIGDE